MSIPDEFGDGGEPTVTKLSTRDKQWHKHDKKDRTTANLMRFQFLFRRKNHGKATSILPRETAF